MKRQLEQIRNWGALFMALTSPMLADAASSTGDSPVFPVDLRRPFIVTPPTSRFVQVGSNATFNVVAYGQPTLNYQWQFNGSPLAGKTSTNLPLSNVQPANAGAYSVIVTNDYGSVTSAVAQLIFLVPTNRSPTTEIVSPDFSGLSGLKLFTNGAFVPSPALNGNQMTIVLTHGFDSNPDAWAANMAAQLMAHVPGLSANIVAWDWRDEAAGPEFPKVFLNSLKCKKQGEMLGKALINRLGVNYNQRVHFMGHSLGTLVNAAAANYLHQDISRWSWLWRTATSAGAYSPTNTHMTLFDEAELANVSYVLSATLSRLSIPLVVKPVFDQPLPKQSAYADNYISIAGLFHEKAVNCFLTNGFAGIDSAKTVGALSAAIADFHSYPWRWYTDTSADPFASLMGNQWGFERNGFSGAPEAGSVYVQSFANSPLNVAKSTEVVVLADYIVRLTTIAHSVGSISYNTAVNILQSVKDAVAAVAGNVTGTIQNALVQDPYANTPGVGGLFQDGWSWQLKLNKDGGSPLAPGRDGPVPMDGPTPGTAPSIWSTVTIPSNARQMSFDFMFEGEGSDDLFAAAIGGTNVFAQETGLLETNVWVNSGLINVAPWSGQQAELFFGIAGTNSANSSVTVQAIRFYSSTPPSLSAQQSGNSLLLTWPLSASDYVLEASSTLTGTNSWTTVTNVPAIVDFQNTVTNPITAGSRFYRLRK